MLTWPGKTFKVTLTFAIFQLGWIVRLPRPFRNWRVIGPSRSGGRGCRSETSNEFLPRQLSAGSCTEPYSIRCNHHGTLILLDRGKHKGERCLGCTTLVASDSLYLRRKLIQGRRSFDRWTPHAVRSHHLPSLSSCRSCCPT